MLARGILLALILFSSASAQQLALTELALRAEPSGVAIRPLDSIPVQALYYGQDGDQRIRLRLDGATFSLAAENSGWLSKPYRFQGEETEAFYEPPSQGLTSILFGRASAQFVLQDAVVYTAPAEPGEYEIRAALNGLEASLKITVAVDAVSLRPDEMISFPLEAPSNYPYRALAEHWAPFIAQETWFQPKADYLARFDFDGDWLGADNWEDAFVGSSQAYVYYEAMETQTHWFLIYNMFHPRDYSDKCVAGSCHENDNEGLILTIRKDGTPFGSLQVMETLATTCTRTLPTLRFVPASTTSTAASSSTKRAIRWPLLNPADTASMARRPATRGFGWRPASSPAGRASPTSTRELPSAPCTPTTAKSATNCSPSTTIGGCDRN
jgi:hypothetical protein